MQRRLCSAPRVMLFCRRRGIGSYTELLECFLQLGGRRYKGNCPAIRSVLGKSISPPSIRRGIYRRRSQTVVQGFCSSPGFRTRRWVGSGCSTATAPTCRAVAVDSGLYKSSLSCHPRQSSSMGGACRNRRFSRRWAQDLGLG